MPKFKYNAVSLSGENISGIYNAPDRSGVVGMLRQGGYFPISISQLDSGVNRATKKKIKVKSLAGFCSQMSAMLKAGVPIAKTLEILKDQSDDRILKKILEDVVTNVHRGSSLSESLEAYSTNFPDMFLNMVEAGEESGTLDICLERAGTLLTRTAKLNNKLKNAMIYPTILLVVLLLLILMMLLFVIPQFVTMFEDSGTELPLFTQILVDLSNFVKHRWYIIALTVSTIVFVVRLWLSSDKGRTAFDRYKFHMPIISKFLKKIYAARYARTLASLNASGVALPKALNVTARSVINKFMEKEIYKVIDLVNRGESLSAPLERMSLLPPMIVYMTRLGEESGTMDSLLIQAADFYDEESDAAIQALMAMLEPLLIVIMAIIIVPIIIAVMLPVFSMYQSV